MAKVLARKAQAGAHLRVVLRRTDTGDEVPMGSGDRTVHVSGLPSELLLHLSGRDADVVITGEPESVDAWRRSVGSL